MTKWLQVRTSWDDVIIYKPYYFPDRDPEQPFTSNLRWTKLEHPLIANWTDSEDWHSEEGSKLQTLTDVEGYSAVFIRGATPSLILKEASSNPKFLELRVPGIQGLTTFHTARCERGFAYIERDVSNDRSI